jgi:hypothetical protein
MRDQEAARQLRRALRLLGLVVLPVGLAWLVTAAVLGDFASFIIGLLGLSFAGYVLIEHRTSGERPVATIATRVAVATELVVVCAATIEPSLSIPMTMAAVVPPILALAYAPHRTVVRLTIVGALVGTWAAVAPRLVPWSSNLVAPLNVLLPVSSLILAYVVFLTFLVHASRRQRETADELRTAIAMSRELSQTLDPERVGELIARHRPRHRRHRLCPQHVGPLR